MLGYVPARRTRRECSNPLIDKGLKMKRTGSTKFLRIGLLVVATAALGGCVTDKEVDAKLDARLAAMEDKVNEALRNSASAKIDATTALSLATGK